MSTMTVTSVDVTPNFPYEIVIEINVEYYLKMIGINEKQ